MFELIFITSSNEKLAHVRHLCADYSLKISKQKNYGIGYSEPRIKDRDSLLRISVEDAILRFSKSVANPESKFFFIEDTSVIIHALSQRKNEVPGVDIKYWMIENDFDTINEEIVKNGNNRSVTVRSDLILVIPENLQTHLGLTQRYLQFTSEMKGSITTKEFQFETQPLYPWLNKRTFNKWFIPEGFEKPISLLKIEDADNNDFRKGALTDMLDFLLAKGYIRKKSILSKDEKSSKQLSLFLFQPLLFIICGPTCAGKTTLARYLIKKYRYYHIEASDFMYLIFYERHGIRSNVEIGDFASEVLLNDPGIVVNRILEDINDFENFPLVITGFRNKKEIEIFENFYNSDLSIVPIYIDAKINVRFGRETERGRIDAEITMADFKIKSIQQNLMGLSEIEKILKDFTIINEGTFDEYFDSFQNQYNQPLDNFIRVEKDYYVNLWSTMKLENAILITLLAETETDAFYTTTEISHLINRRFEYRNIPKNKNNISRYFNQNFSPYFEVNVLNGKVAYKLSNTGYSRALLLKK